MLTASGSRPQWQACWSGPRHKARRPEISCQHLVVRSVSSIARAAQLSKAMKQTILQQYLLLKQSRQTGIIAPQARVHAQRARSLQLRRLDKQPPARQAQLKAPGEGQYLRHTGARMAVTLRQAVQHPLRRPGRRTVQPVRQDLTIHTCRAATKRAALLGQHPRSTTLSKIGKRHQGRCCLMWMSRSRGASCGTSGCAKMCIGAAPGLQTAARELLQGKGRSERASMRQPERQAPSS